MRFYGISNEQQVVEMLNKLPDGEWIFEDLKENKREVLSRESAVEKLKELISQVQNWKKDFTTLGKNTVFIFVHIPSNPKVFKIYDISSLGCSSCLSPPRWRVFLKENEDLQSW